MARLTTPSRPHRIRISDGDWEEGQADYVCPDCGCRYDEHIKVPGYYWLRELCDGTLVKIGRG